MLRLCYTHTHTFVNRGKNLLFFVFAFAFFMLIIERFVYTYTTVLCIHIHILSIYKGLHIEALYIYLSLRPNRRRRFLPLDAVTSLRCGASCFWGERPARIASCHVGCRTWTPGIDGLPCCEGQRRPDPRSWKKRPVLIPSLPPLQERLPSFLRPPPCAEAVRCGAVRWVQVHTRYCCACNDG